ncbi:MAG: hypothetical protein IPP88_24950 [Betaproteobacteria bacterium]|nr:hypothetical protein [Betaproteobacteria bacterium]
MTLLTTCGSALSIPDVVMGVRDSAFLKWRFVDMPSKSYRFFTLMSSTDKRLVAYAVCDADSAVMNVDDFLVDPTVPSAATRLWLELSREATRMGHSSLCVEFLGSDQEQRQLSAAGLIVRDQRPVYASFAVPSPATNKCLTDASTWYLTSADDD